MGIFKKKALGKVKTFKPSQYFQEGNYIAKIISVEFKEGRKGDFFIITAEVLGTLNTVAGSPEVGDRAAHVWMASGDKEEIGMAQWMQFLTAVFGCEVEEHDDDTWDQIATGVCEDNELEDTCMYLEVFDKKTRAGGDFTQHVWQAVATDKDFKKFGIKNPA